MMLWVFIFILLLLCGLGAVAFVTLLERKLLGLSQIRLGPNKLILLGVLQPVLDGLKLLLKETLHMLLAQSFLLAIGPMIVLLIFFIILGLLLPWAGSGVLMNHYSFLLLFVVLGLGTYSIMVIGWASTSPFSKMGSLRSMLQSLSFEVALVLVFFFPLFLFSSLSMKNEMEGGIELFPWALTWVFLVLMESNRAPFDLLEGESELISGFNIEMSSTLFVFIFLSEYGTLMALGVLTSIGLQGGLSMASMSAVVISLFIRSCYPRVRYDVLMSMMWQAILPLSLVMLLLTMAV
uniref:NADH-ubiquinone oxidoreductase chain 1 n=1 Tax=Longidorus vineacola TaxID=241698 RepID=A0A1P8C754_9BILA|nr:NADH dehydrogenase subunit 1 [Longidorus vineacola]AOT84235.1 NADH dehydrogenase subunit 1 [Longidorus vineacola]